MYSILLALLLQEADFKQAFLEPISEVSAAEPQSLLDVSVLITVLDKRKKASGWGSGVLIKDGVLTCEHVVAGLSEGSQIICTYKDQDVLVTIERSDRLKDLALLKLPETVANWPRAQVSDKPAFTGESLRSCGRGISGLPRIDNHKVVRLYEAEHRRDIEYTNAPVGGRSGSGVFNTKGHVVGIVRAHVSWSSEEYGSAVAMDASDLSKFLEDTAPPVPTESPIGDAREIVVSTASWCGFCHEMQRDIEKLYKNGKGNPSYTFKFVDVTKNLPKVVDESGRLRDSLLPLATWKSKSNGILYHEGKIGLADLIAKVERNDPPKSKEGRRR